MSAREQSMLCAPIVTRTCAATMQLAASSRSRKSEILRSLVIPMPRCACFSRATGWSLVCVRFRTRLNGEILNQKLIKPGGVSSRGGHSGKREDGKGRWSIVFGDFFGDLFGERRWLGRGFALRKSTANFHTDKRCCRSLKKPGAHHQHRFCRGLQKPSAMPIN
jgi:hypothetical protein